ncbi:hypothetical protein D3C87_1905170 [compost metagenome]
MGRLAIESDVAAAAVAKADHGFSDGRAARTDQPGKAEDFTLAQVKGNVPDALGHQVAHGQHHRRIHVGFVLGRIEVG